MSEPGREGESTEQGPSHERFSDRITGPVDAIRIITESDPTKADEALERLAQHDDVAAEIAAELAQVPPLADPAAFPQAHRSLMRALEVYHRNARRWPSRLPAGFLRPVVTPVVGVMTGAIAHAHQRRVIGDVRRLYAMREANSVVGTPAHRVLVTARRQVDQLSPDLVSRGFAIPAFLLGGAAISAIASVLQDLLRDTFGRLVLLGVVLLITVGAFWCIVTAAAVTRRRTRSVLDEPLRALWQAVGAAGPAPHEPSRGFVAAASLLLIIGWIIAPLAVAVLSQLW